MMKKRRLNSLNWVYFIFAIAVIVFLLLVFELYNTHTSAQEVFPIQMRGSYSTDYGKNWTSFAKFEDIKKEGKQLLIKGNVLEDIPAGERIMMYLYRLDVKLGINGEVVYSGNEVKYTRWDKYTSQGISKKDVITLCLNPLTSQKYDGSYDLFLTNFSRGSEIGLLYKQIKGSSVKIILCILIFVMGIASILVAVGMMFLEVPETKGFMSCALLLVVGAMCTFIDYEYITLLFDNAFVVNILDFLTQMLIVLLLLIYLKNYLKTPRYVKMAQTVSLFWIETMMIYFVLRLFGIVEEENIVFVLAVEVLIFMSIMGTCLVLDLCKFKEKRTKYVLVSLCILMLATGIEVVHYVVTNIFWIHVFQGGLILFALTQYYVLMSYSREKIRDANRKRELESELAKNRISIMMSQIQPHFLYNTLTVIYNLCDINPEQAQEATAKFSDYLRGNLDSLDKAVPVPFATELEHIRIYLDLEKMRFGDELNIEYDIKTTNFMIPALTIQPLIENAVKHGLGKKEEGGTVTICTRENEEFYEVEIRDDGVGFDQTKKVSDGRSHVGIENVKSRLWSMSQGKLDIFSEVGKGTITTIYIPKKGE